MQVFHSFYSLVSIMRVPDPRTYPVILGSSVQFNLRGLLKSLLYENFPLYVNLFLSTFLMSRVILVRLVHDLNSAFCLVIGGVLNILLIYLIRRKTSKEMTVYSRILLQTCIIDLYVLTIGYLLQPVT